MRLDAKTIATLDLPPGKDDHIEWDSDLAGFGLRLRQGGKRVWVVQYRSPGSRRTRRVTLGSVKKLTPAQAREAARGLLAHVVTGRDPQGEREARRARRRARSATRSKRISRPSSPSCGRFRTESSSFTCSTATISGRCMEWA